MEFFCHGGKDILRLFLHIHAEQVEKKILRLANRTHSKVRQLAALEKMVEDNLLRHQEQVESVLSAAGQASIRLE